MGDASNFVGAAVVGEDVDTFGVDFVRIFFACLVRAFSSSSEEG